ncbi:hypothetical protein J7K93_09900 [bacterium]|nr:hypothetical protein [bacterium]
MGKNKFTLQLTIIFVIAVFAAGSAQIKRVHVFQNAADFAPQINFAKAAVDTTLPEPKLHSEPEYTWGLENTVYWNSDSIKAVVAKVQAKVILYEVEALYNDVEKWGYVDSWKNSATFNELPGGVEISYRIRYLADKGSDNYAFSKWSPVETSIQDVSPPFITQWTIKHLQKSGGINWIIGQTIDNRIIAADTALGKVMEISIREISESIEQKTSINIKKPRPGIDTTFQYTILSPAHEQLSLVLQVKDLAGQLSKPDTIVIFWWPFEGEDKDVLCFPNPFNPEVNERSIIKCSVPEATEARIYDLFGNLVRVLTKTADDYFFEWDGRNGEGDVVSNGGYVCVIRNALSKYCKIAVIR